MATTAPAIAIFSSREFNQDTGKAKKAAEQGPVIITNRGEPSFVLLSIDEYRKLQDKHMSVAELFYYPGADEIELELPERKPYHPRELDLS